MTDVELHPFGYAPERCPKCGHEMDLGYQRRWNGEGRFIGAAYCPPHLACSCYCGYMWRTKTADADTPSPETV